MTDYEKLLKKRFAELSARAQSRDVRTFSDFLTMAEQDMLISSDVGPFELFGGYDGAERRIACFGTEEDGCFIIKPPVKCLLVEPASKKFAEQLTHRDFLGALMSLGVKRETLGDILLSDGVGYVFCLESVAEFIVRELCSIRRTTVSARISELPEKLRSPEPEVREVVVSSERADALIAAVYRLSRSEAQELFAHGRIFVNSRLIENTSRTLAVGDVVSVRGHGRFVYDGTVRETKKGRLRVILKVF